MWRFFYGQQDNCYTSLPFAWLRYLEWAQRQLALWWVISYFALGTLVSAINLSTYSIPLSQLFRPSQLIAVALQFIVVYAVFRKIQMDDDSYVAPLVWGAVGCVGVFFVMPSAVELIGMKL